MSYINKYTLLGMLSRSYTVSSEELLIYRKKDKSKAMVFNKDYKNPKLCEITYAYIEEKPTTKSFYSSNEVISFFAKDYFIDLKKHSKEIYQTKKKWDKYITIKHEIEDVSEVLDLLDRWVKFSGLKYHWNRHDGYDRTFFLKHYLNHKDELKCNFFYYDNKLVGYSVISPKINDTYFYILRKVDITAGRNICEYVDYKTFELLNDKEFFVNWGASSGGVLQYKKKKFPLFSEKPVYFWKEHNNEI